MAKEIMKPLLVFTIWSMTLCVKILSVLTPDELATAFIGRF